MLFTDRQRRLVTRAAEEAEQHTARYYCIPPFRWESLPYDVLTCGDAGWRPLPDAALAEVLCLQRPQARNGKSRDDDFYRIQLNDRRILEAATREKLEGLLYPFMIYILTHELVHLVRLSSILDRRGLTTSHCRVEEGRVQRISRQILSRVEHPGLAPVLERFCVSPAG